MTFKILFIDDERDPNNIVYKELFPANSEIYLIQQLHDLLHWIDEHGVPDIVSFDFHLHKTDQLRNGGDYAAMMMFELENIETPIEKLPYIMVHSADPEAPEKILKNIQYVFSEFTWEQNEKRAPKANISTPSLKM